MEERPHRLSASYVYEDQMTTETAGYADIDEGKNQTVARAAAKGAHVWKKNVGRGDSNAHLTSSDDEDEEDKVQCDMMNKIKRLVEAKNIAEENQGDNPFAVKQTVPFVIVK
eukprot:4238681-Pyramimonas_sp.AAC.1